MKRLFASVLGVALIACDGNNDPDLDLPPGTTIEAAGGTAQSFTAGQPAAAPVEVVVENPAGQPISGVPVSFSAVAAGASVAPATAITNAQGVAGTVYTAGSIAGTQALHASVPGLQSLTVDLLVQPGPAASLGKVSGDGQSGTVGVPLPQQLRVRAVDALGNGVSGVAVTWTMAGGAGTLSASSVPSDAEGYSSVSLTPGSPNMQVSAAAAGLTPRIFTVTAQAIRLVGQVPVPSNYGLHDQYIRDGIAFLSAWNSGLMIFDVGGGGLGGSVTNPAHIGTIVTAANGVAGGAAVHNAWWYHAPDGQKRYVFVGQEGPGAVGSSSSGDIHVVDVSDMSAPVEVAFYRLAGAGTHNFWVDEANEILYAAYYNGGVVALDISGTLSGDLATREIDRIQPAGAAATYVWGVQLFNGSLYATDMRSGFWQLRLANSAFEVLGGGNNVPERFGSDQWVHGNYAYSGTWGNRGGRAGNAVKIWQLGAGGAPVLVDSIITANIGTVSDVEVSADGQLLMFSAENGSGAGLYFYDLRVSPGDPVFIARYPVATGVHTATFSDIGGRRYVFAAQNPAGPAMLILDVTALLQ